MNQAQREIPPSKKPEYISVFNLSEINDLLTKVEKVVLSATNRQESLDADILAYKTKSQELKALLDKQYKLESKINKIKTEPETLSDYIDTDGNVDFDLLFSRIEANDAYKEVVRRFFALNISISSRAIQTTLREDNYIKIFKDKFESFKIELENKIKSLKAVRLQHSKDELARFNADNTEHIKALHSFVQKCLLDDVFKNKLEEIEKKETETTQAEILKYCRDVVLKLANAIDHTKIKLSSVLGEEKIPPTEDSEKLTQPMINVLLNSSIELESLFAKARVILRDAVLLEDGEKRIKKPSDVVPWAFPIQGFKPGDYKKVLQYLKNNLNTLKTINNKESLETYEIAKKIIDYTNMVYQLVGPEYIKNNKSQRIKSEFWSLFEQRKFNDKHGITKKLQEARDQEIQLEKDLDIQIQEILKEGGILVDVPIQKGYKRGAVLLGFTEQSKKGNSFWRVLKKTSNITDKDLNPNTTSKSDFSGFPQWLQVKVLNSKNLTL